MAVPASPALKRKRAARNAANFPSRKMRHGHLMEGLHPLHIGGIPQLDKMSDGFVGSMYEAMPIRASGVNGPFIASNDISNSGIYADRNGLHLAGTTGTTGFIQFYSSGWVIKGKIYYRDSSPNALHIHVIDNEDIVFRVGGTGIIGFVAGGYTMGSTSLPLGQLHVDKLINQSIEFDEDEAAPNIPGDSTPAIYRDNSGDIIINFPTGQKIDIKEENVSKGTIDASGVARIATGSYTGNGAVSQVITGVGFTPKYVRIWSKEGTPGDAIWIGETTTDIIDDDPSGGFVQLFHDTGVEGIFNDDAIIQLNSDGFIVDDNTIDSHPNRNTHVYNYMALG